MVDYMEQKVVEWKNSLEELATETTDEHTQLQLETIVEDMLEFMWNSGEWG